MRVFTVLAMLVLAVSVQGCVHKLVTTPVKVAYGVTKGVAKGTVAVAKAVIPGDSKKEEKSE